MNIRKYFIFILFITVSFQAFSSGNSDRNANNEGISARGAVGRLETAVSGPMYTGNGGSNIRLAVLAPDVQGDVPSYLPIHIQGKK